MTKLFTAVKLSAPNDYNGNPRRLWVVSELVTYEAGGEQHQHYNRVDVIDQQYNGTAELHSKYPNVLQVMDIEVSAAEYRKWIKVGENDIKLRQEQDPAFLYAKCLAEAEKLETKYFMPALDMIENETLSSILFKVLIEHDVAVEGHTDAPKAAIESWSRRVSKFFVKWRDLLPEEDRGQYMGFKLPVKEGN